MRPAEARVAVGPVWEENQGPEEVAEDFRPEERQQQALAAFLGAVGPPGETGGKKEDCAEEKAGEYPSGTVDIGQEAEQSQHGNTSSEQGFQDIQAGTGGGRSPFILTVDLLDWFRYLFLAGALE